VEKIGGAKMSVEIWADINTTKKDFLNNLKSLGFVKGKFFLGDTKGKVYYAHFEPRDYLSFDGVEIAIIEQKNGLHINGRVRASGSYYDREKLNGTFKTLRKIYNFSFESDYGKNRYIPIGKDNSTPIGRGIFYYSESLQEQLHNLKICMPDRIIQKPKVKITKTTKQFFDSIEPMLTLYNGLLPLLVAYIEEFYKRLFVVLIQFDKLARQKLSKKIELKNILDSQNDFISLEVLIANSYNFQNADEIIKTFNKLFGLSINIGVTVKQIIEKRHNLVHGFNHTQIFKKDMLLYIDAIIKMIATSISEIEKKYKIKVSI
jgi:hypothetical protein